MDTITVLYEFENFEDHLQDYAKILKQGVYTKERLNKYLNEAKESTLKLLENGKFLHRVSVYVHKGVNFTYKKAIKVDFQ